MRRTRWTVHVASMGERRVAYRVLVGKPVGKDHFGDPVLNERIILRWILRKWGVGVWTGSI